jgi:glucose/mannose-6-phosphate isomerase
VKDLIARLPQQLREGARLGAAASLTEKPYRYVVCTGMGGSSIAGELFSMVRNGVIVHWDYGLPTGIGAQDLVICTSWSGNTEETISAYESARAMGIDTLCITGGGKLASLANEHSSPLVLLSKADEVPRANVGLMAGALLAALGLEATLPTNLDGTAMDSQGKELADALAGRIPVVYASHPWRKLTGFWKMAYSETAKRQVVANWFPSGAHTEIVGWEGPYAEQVAFLLLKDPTDDAKYTKNFDALLALLPQKGYTVRTVELSGTALLEKALNAYLLALWTGYHTALNLGIDPQATALLDEFKKAKAR